jgi:hypothetical protein
MALEAIGSSGDHQGKHVDSFSFFEGPKKTNH